MIESVLQRLILGQLSAFPRVWVWRSSTGAAYDRSGRLMRFGLKGQADISGLVTLACGHAVPLYIEVKSDTGRLTPEQRAFGERVESMGGVYIVARCLDDVLTRVRSL